ncbi:MAG TPA: biotin transporter BioY [Planctomycetota bacterium]|nr:biotin transporter BioY [Planctomycetota bacterium]
MSSPGVVSSWWAREVPAGRQVAAVVGVAGTVLCLALAAEARVYLPFTPVPITLQTFFVLVAGAGLGPRLGTVALSSYLALGAVGVPIFTGQWLGPTTGYLVGFVAAGWLVGALTRRVAEPSMARLVLAMALGDAILLVLGAAWLALGCGYGVPMALEKGILCFLPGDALKLIAAAAFCRSYRDSLRSVFP